MRLCEEFMTRMFVFESVEVGAFIGCFQNEVWHN